MENENASDLDDGASQKNINTPTPSSIIISKREHKALIWNYFKKY